MSLDFGKECNDFIGCQSEAIKSKKESVYKKENELISDFLDEKNKDEQTKKLSKLINIIDDCIKIGHINFITASMVLLSRLTAPKDVKFQKKLIPETVNNVLEYITSKFENINCVKFIVKILKSFYEEYPYIKEQIIPIVLKYFTGEKTNIIAYGNITHNNALKIISNIINDLIEKKLSLTEEQKDKFLIVIIDLIDETQDPRNLKLIFDFVPKLSLFISKNILEKYSQKIFECLFGFFPINFNSQDIKNVKKEELISEEELTKLLNNLLSQEIFNKYLFDNIDPEDYKNSSDLLLLYQSVIKNYSYDLLAKYYDNIINYIFTTLEENNEEFLSIECFITYKSFLEKYYPYDDHIESTWNKLSDYIFSDNEKKMIIGKDMLCPIITYDKQNKYLTKSIELFLKMISLYSFDLNKYMLIKLANSIIFFFLKKKNEKEYEQAYMNAVNILKQNNKLIINLIKDRKYYIINNDVNGNERKLTNTNLFIIIADIITGIITKINKIEIFEKNEKIEVYNIVYNFYINEINIDDENEKDLEHICILIVELANNIDGNNNINLYKNAINLFSEKNKKSNYLIKQIYDINDDIKFKKTIIKDMIEYIEKNEDSKNILIELLSMIKNSDKKVELLKDYNKDLEKIITSHITDENYKFFIENIICSMDNIYITKIIEYIINFLLNKEEINNKELSLKIQKFLKVYFTIAKDREKNIDIGKIEELFKKVKLIYDRTNKENKYFILVSLKKLFKHCGFEYQRQIIDDLILSKFNASDKKCNENQSENKIFNDINLEPYISLIINYLLKNYEVLVEKKIINDTFDENLLTKIFEEINSMEQKDKKVFEKSFLFKIKDISDKLKDKILVKLKKYYSSKNNDNNQFLNLLMNLYNSLTKEEQEKNLDILFTLNIECINKKINPIRSIFNLRKILININPKEIIKLSDLFNIYPLCKNIITIIKDEQYNNNEQLKKIEGIKLIGILLGFIQEEEWENEDKKLIIFYLKKYFLNDKKRKVRYATGIVLNLLSCSTSKICFYNE
jgi:hypothetical protein